MTMSNVISSVSTSNFQDWFTGTLHFSRHLFPVGGEEPKIMLVFTNIVFL